MRCELGAWSFRAFCSKSCKPDVAVQSAQMLQNKLRARGITTLRHVKHEVDRISRRPDARTICKIAGEEKEVLSHESIVRLFQQWGLDISSSSSSGRGVGSRRIRGAGRRGAQDRITASYGHTLRPLAQALQRLWSTSLEEIIETLAIKTA